MPFGEAAAAAIAPALVSASAAATMAAVLFPLQRGTSNGAGATAAYGASCGTLSCTSERVTGSSAGGCGTRKPGGGDPGSWADTTPG